MPDTTPPSTQTAEAPPSEDGWRPDLLLLRARLDEIDDHIHDLLMDRALVIESVARSGKPAAYRPGREAAILRRLLARHTGKLPPQTLVRMWRELLAGTTAMQTAVTVAVFDGSMTALAKEHFGFLTRVTTHGSAEAALRDVRAGLASVAVLPFPRDGAPWWPALTLGGPRLYIVGRLPFWANRPAADALVVAAAAPDASGSDLTVCAVDGTVVEVEGMLAEDDPRLPAGAIVLGGYAIPVAGEPV